MALTKYKDVPPLWWLIALVTLCLMLLFFPGATFIPIRIFGGVLFVVSVAIFIAAVPWFKRRKTTIHPHHEPAALITEGIFAYSRNPIYLSMVLSILGIGLAMGLAVAPAVALALGIVINQRFIVREEAGLHAAFGARAEAYFKQTRRWL